MSAVDAELLLGFPDAVASVAPLVRLNKPLTCHSVPDVATWCSKMVLFSTDYVVPRKETFIRFQKLL